MSIIKKEKINDNNKKNKICNNSLTMQKALETAYDDWNKNKADQTVEDNDTTTVNNSNKLETEENKTVDSAVKDVKQSESTIEKETVTKIAGSSSLMTNSNPSPTLTSIPYYSGNPLVDLVKGVMHIYKDKYSY